VNKRKPLAAVVGAGCCAILVAYVPRFEGTMLQGYRDPIGIVTACTGHTGAGAEMGRTYTPEECQQFLQTDLVQHAEGVLACTPGLRDKQGPLAAAVSFAFNVGTAKYCGSTMARKFNAGDVMGACAELSRWTYAGGEQLPGLIQRRAAEREICEGRKAA
jgi:lysozyme